MQKLQNLVICMRMNLVEENDLNNNIEETELYEESDKELNKEQYDLGEDDVSTNIESSDIGGDSIENSDIDPSLLPEENEEDWEFHQDLYTLGDEFDDESNKDIAISQLEVNKHNFSQWRSKYNIGERGAEKIADLDRMISKYYIEVSADPHQLNNVRRLLGTLEEMWDQMIGVMGGIDISEGDEIIKRCRELLKYYGKNKIIKNGISVDDEFLITIRKLKNRVRQAMGFYRFGMPREKINQGYNAKAQRGIKG